jgi:hypothetical protein
MSKLTPNRPVAGADPVHDGRHALRDLPLERESIPYVVSLPEHRIGTFIYTWVTKDNIAGSVFVAYGPGVGDQPIVEAIDGVTMGPEKNFDDWKVGKLHLQQDLRLQNATLKVETDRVSLDARFEALHPAYAYSAHPEGCPDWAATDRLEQAGRIKGTLRIDGRTLAFDTTAARDHSWGTRNWDTPQHWKWLHAQAGPGTAVHFWQIQARGRTVLRGYVLRDGRMAEVDHVDVDWRNDPQYRHTHIEATVHDTAGRTTRVKGEYFGHFPLVPVPSCTLFEGAMRCEIDGQAGVGWSEFMWPTAYLEHLRNEMR